MPAVPHVDLRQSERIPAAVPIGLVAESDGFKVEREAATVDLSPQGAKVRTPLQLLPGEAVGVIVRGDIRHAISARVVWAQRAGTDQWSHAGLKFLETLPA